MMKMLAIAKARGLNSQNKLAAAAGITPADLSKIVNRRMVPYPGQLRKLAAALGYSESEAPQLLEEVPFNQAASLKEEV